MAEIVDTLTPEAENGVEVEWLDYDYVGKCSDAKKLKAILSVLRSGKEGHYPDLEQFTEKRLLEVLPEKERQQILRLKQKPSQNDVSMAEFDLREWESNIGESDSKLRKVAKETPTATKEVFEDSKSLAKSASRPLPPVRGTKAADAPVATTTIKSTAAPKVTEVETAAKPKRISGYDFRAWERFDAEEAAEAVEREEAQLRESESQRGRAEMEQRRKVKEEEARRRRQTYQQEMDNVLESLRASDMTELQLKTRAEREKQKGNEYFRAGELENALDCYTKSIALDPSNHVVHANRAVVHLKLDKLTQAEDDCTRALGLDRTYVKAWSRRGMTRFRLGRYAEAADDFEEGLALQPDSKEIQGLLANAEKKHAEVEGRPYVSKYARKERQEAEARAAFQQVVTRPLCTSVAATDMKELYAFVGSIAGGSIGKVLSEGRLVAAPVAVVEGLQSSPAPPAGQEKLTRIAIVEDDDDEEEDEEEGAAAGETAAPTTPVSERFTRVTISEESDEDDDDNGNDESDGSQQQRRSDHEKEETFTKVVIEEETDEESDTEEVPIRSQSQSTVDVATIVTQANVLKERGNDSLKNKDATKAIELYSQALALLAPFQSTTSLPGKERAAVTDCLLAVTNNRAMAYLNTKQHDLSLADCDTVLAQQPTNTKARYRRAVNLKELGKLEESLRELSAVLAVEPANAMAQQLQQELHHAVQLQRAAEEARQVAAAAAASSVRVESAPKTAAAVPTPTPKPTPKPPVASTATSSSIPAPPAVAIEEAATAFICDEWSVEQQRQKVLKSIQKGNISTALQLSTALTASVNASGSSSDAASNISTKSIVSVLTLHITVCGLSERWSDVVSAADALLKIDAKNCRALIKRADAKERQGELQSARTDLVAALRIDGTNTEAMGLLDSIEQQLADKSSTSSTTASSSNASDKSSAAAAVPLPPPPKPAVAASPAPAPAPAAAVVPPPAPPVEETKSAAASETPAATKQQSDAERAIALKEAGNECIKTGDFKRALELYNESIALDSSSAATHSNRAQAHLKLNNFVQAEQDATTALTLNNNSADKMYHRALNRRAQARKGLGGVAKLELAVQDFRRLYELDPVPANKKELDTVLRQLQQLQQQKDKEAVPVVKPATAAVPSSSSAGGGSGGDFGLSAVKTTLKKRVVETLPETPTQAPRNEPKEVDASNSSTASPTPAAGASPSPNPLSSSIKKKKSTSNVNVNIDISVPTEPPQSLYEFERIWRGMKERPDVFAQYLAVFKKSTFKKMAKESISSELLTSLWVALRDHAPVKVIVTALEGLRSADTFSMMVTLLPAEDVLVLKSVFAKLLLDGGSAISVEDVKRLQKAYGVV